MIFYRRRLFWAAVTLLVIFIEVMIALFVHDSFVRPYLGDVIVVFAVYSFVRIFFPRGFMFLPSCVFLFAVCVEILQAADILGFLGIARDGFLGILLGGTFDIKDIICYFSGCIVILITFLLEQRSQREYKSRKRGQDYHDERETKGVD